MVRSITGERQHEYVAGDGHARKTTSASSSSEYARGRAAAASARSSGQRLWRRRAGLAIKRRDLHAYAHLPFIMPLWQSGWPVHLYSLIKAKYRICQDSHSPTQQSLALAAKKVLQ